MKVVITGATGLVGRRVTELLQRQGYAVAAVSKRRRIAPDALLVDLSDPQEVSRLPTDAHCMIHLAALLPAPRRAVRYDEWLKHNTQTTLNVLEHCAKNGIRNVVYGSTWSVYGSNPSRIPTTESCLPAPSDFYSLSKLSGEILTHPYTFSHRMDVKILRFSYVYGDGMRKDTVVEQFIDLALRNEDIPLVNDGTDVLDLIYAKDAASAVARAIDARAGTYNVGGGGGVLVRDLARAICKATSSSSSLVTGPTRARRQSYLSIHKAGAEMQWAPQFSLEQGVRDLLSMRVKNV